MPLVLGPAPYNHHTLNGPFQPLLHLSSIQYTWGPGSKIRWTSKLHQPIHSRLSGSAGMVGSDKYGKYFAQSTPGPREQQSARSSPAKSTDNRARYSSYSSPRPSDRSGASVDSSGTYQARKSHVTLSTNSLNALAKVPLHPRDTDRVYRRHDSESDDDSDYSSSAPDSPRSEASTASSMSTLCAQEVLKQRKSEALEKLMTRFYAFFRPWLENTYGVECQCTANNDHECRDDDGGCSGSHGPGGSGGGSGGSGGGPKRSLAGQKRSQRDSDDCDGDGVGENDGDGGDDGKRKGSKRVKKETEKLFACPFFKRYPDRFRNQKTCCGPGWPEVHRLKEHLYRRHMLPRFMCPRCLAEFPDDKHLKEHQRRQTPCLLKIASHDDTRFDQAVETELRRRKPKGSERKKWDDIYKILFPGQPVPANPYYDGPQPKAGDINHFGEYIHRELPPLVKEHFSNEIDKRLEGLLPDLEPKIFTLFEAVIKKYQEEYAPPPAPLPQSRVTSPPATMGFRSRGSTPAPSSPLPNGMGMSMNMGMNMGMSMGGGNAFLGLGDSTLFNFDQLDVPPDLSFNWSAPGNNLGYTT